jgi:hypothetical protein
MGAPTPAERVGAAVSLFFEKRRVENRNSWWLTFLFCIRNNTESVPILEISCTEFYRAFRQFLQAGFGTVP